MNKNKTLLNGIIKKIMNDNLNYLYSQSEDFSNNFIPYKISKKRNF